MPSFEFEGKNLNQAVKKACEELNLAPDEIKYDVLAFGSSGIFGLAGAKKARIRVQLPDTPEDDLTATESAERKNAATGDQNAIGDFALKAESADASNSYALPENPLELGRAVLQRIVAAITADATITAEENSEKITLKVAGGNPAVLIGKKGQTLEAIQSVVEKIVNKHHNTDSSEKIRVQVDVEGYLETRKANLEKLAARLAEKSKRIGKPISLWQMSAFDRRIIHLALKDDPDVFTQSRGEGYIRKLVIFPQKNSLPRQQIDS